MFRLYFGLLVFAIVAALTGVAYFLSTPVERSISSRAERQNFASGEVVELANRLHDYSLVRAAEELAAVPELVRALQCPETDEDLDAQRALMVPQTAADGTPLRDARGRMLDQRGQPSPEQGPVLCARTRHGESLRILRRWARDRQSFFEEAEAQFLSARPLGAAEARAPDILLVAGADGVVIARAGHDLENWYGPERPNMTRYPAVGRVELFGTQYGFIPWQERETESVQLARIAAVPVGLGDEDEDEILGVLIMGYFITNNSADEMARLSAQDDLAIYMRLGDNVAIPGSSLQARERLRQHLVSGRFEQGEEEPFGIVALTDRPGALVHTEHDDARFLVGHRRLSTERMGDVSFNVGALVVTPVSAHVAPFERLRGALIPSAIIAFLLGGLGILFILRTMMRPIEEISGGVHEVIAGNRDYMWDVDKRSYLSDLSHSLNIMSARLQGKPDPDVDHSASFTAASSGNGGAAESRTGRHSALPTEGGGVVGLGGLRGRRSQSASEEDDKPEGSS